MTAAALPTDVSDPRRDPAAPPGEAAGGRFPPLLLIGTDFRLSPLALRERVAYEPEAAEDLLVSLLARESVAEASLLSTCNRTELYVLPRRDERPAYRSVLDTAFLPRAPEIEREGRLYVRRDAEAGRHLLRVAAGLESMVLGEPEILGQVRQAHELAEAVGATGAVTRRLLRVAAETGRRARAETAISTGAVSLGYAVVELARNIFSDLSQAGVLVLGAGETARQVVRNLLDRGARRVQVANRGAERARRLAEEHPGIETLPLEARYEALAAAEVVVATTSAGEPLLTVDGMRAALARRRPRPLLAVDLGVPRNVEEAVGRLANVFLHSIDSLDVLIQRNLRRRREEVPRVEEIVEQELARFSAWYRGLAAEPLVARLQKQAEEVRRRELAAALGRFPPETHDDLDRLTRSLVRKILHHPSTRLRGRRAGEGDEIERLDLVRELFHLGEEDDEGGGGTGGGA
ncbi:MAG TPA: glutamyl-tRNA reductase [Thermoanaerobaculia bacterium]|nr:glutamyl-tRNA reductase [Thermoanaerobaculia bacterium]